MSTSENSHLCREWIDFKLGKELQVVIADEVEGRPGAFGQAVATQCVCIVSAVISGVPNEMDRIAILSDVFRFMTDLLNNGWSAPPSKGETN